MSGGVWIIGRKPIMEAMGVSSWSTVRLWRDGYAFPLRSLPNGRPFVLRDEMIAWAITYSDLKKNEKKT